MTGLGYLVAAVVLGTLAAVSLSLILGFVL